MYDGTHDSESRINRSMEGWSERAYLFFATRPRLNATLS